ncbi:hypothetical protein O6H91_02G115500 [Diphasiastrum complanatum]|uniref:Uncharacterized protein n=2 Tax=Diphasiastrum complanatum TaxID=34168 RepID=A0ACC2BFK1_DIPCM|nr:hypothetical protein O6H91_15G006300 [Diphasiastrum complanatum]KAJ7566711.1 hypothetical protein O6H91_02G115500 [Diphasiastrum complanatum]
MAFRAGRSLSLLRSVGRTLGSTKAAGQAGFFEARRFATAAPAVEDDIVKNIVVDQIRKFRAFMEELIKVKIVIAPEDPKVVKDYAQTITNIRKKLQIPSIGEKLEDLFHAAWEDSPTVRAYLETLSGLRTEIGIKDDRNVDKLLFEALEKIEKKIGKPLTRNDAKGLALWQTEQDMVLKKLGILDEKLAKYEEELELGIAKGQLEEMKNIAVDTMETYKKRDGLDFVQVDPKELDPRNFL